MSYDPQADTPPVESEKPKSKKKWWIFGGLGCMLSIGLCCGGILLAGFLITQPVRQIIAQSQAFARDSDAVVNAVGEPVAVSDAPDPMWPTTYKDGENQIQEFRYAVQGSKASGDLVIKIAITPPMNYERQSLTLELDDGTVVDLDIDEELYLDIDDGSTE